MVNFQTNRPMHEITDKFQLINISDQFYIHFILSISGVSMKLRRNPTRNHIWGNQKSWRKIGSISSYANRDIVDYSDGHADSIMIKRKSVEERHSTIRKIVKINNRIKVNVLNIDSYLNSFTSKN